MSEPITAAAALAAVGIEWRPVPGYEGTYCVSNLGAVISVPRNTTRGGRLKSRPGKRGYPVVALVQDGVQRTRYVHHLVAEAFLGPRPEGQEVRHLDGDRANPHLSNLAYGTHAENAADMRTHGTNHNARKTHCPQGHPYSGHNLLVSPKRPNRACRACNVEYRKRSTERARAVKQSPDFDERWTTQ